jgi:high-affinity nickel-transport protein
VFYNLAITGLSVAICFFIGGIEVLGLLPAEIHSMPQGGFWGFMLNFDINKAGFVIVGLFIVTWATALLVWRYGHIEEKWSARIAGVSPRALDEDEELLMTRTDAEERIKGSQHLPEEST